jgi:2-dehydropantoate 2-reductase
MLHILGAGAIGLFHAHIYAKQLKVPVVLLKRKAVQSSATILVNTIESKKESSTCQVQEIGSSQEPIQNLVVSTRAYDALNAVKSIRSRLDDAHVILLTNGVVQVKKELETLGLKNITMGLTTHGVIRNSEFEITHTGRGETLMDSSFPLKSNLIMPIDTKEMEEKAQLKVAINACINPLTALLHCKNGQLTLSKRLIKSIAEEIATVTDFQVSYLEEAVETVCMNTSLNTNSMLVDILANRKTEIDYINGYFCELGKQKGTPLILNEFLVELIHAKRLESAYRIK